MRQLAFILVLVLLVCCGFVQNIFAQQKLAQTGFNFLNVGTDARATAMGEAFTTVQGSSTALFYNPAGLAGISKFMDFSTNQLKWIADIKYLSGAVAVAPYGGEYGVVGISVMTINYGNFKFTRVANNEQGYEDVDSYPMPNAYVVGIGYGKELSNQFSVGGQAKYAYQSLGKSLVPVYKQTTTSSGVVKTDTSYDLRDYNVGTIAFDFGTIYKTGLKSLAFGVSINNFSREIRYERESFQLPLTFKIGLSMNLMDLVPDLADDHSLFVSIDAVHPRAYVEYLNIGGEYVFGKTVALRAGYISHHADYSLTAGIGVQKFGVAVDYSFMPHKVFSDIQRISVRFSF
ncbi:MAG: PorV/PorQ family protein [Ignavibacteriales bacterium]|nr:PorV/PorQ family protein [Ignavibacteriales bacterium]